MQECGEQSGLVNQVDASAALGIAQREGLGKLRHLQTDVIWLQSRAGKKALEIEKSLVWFYNSE